MRFQLLTDTPRSRHLVLLFAGWGMSPRPLQGVAMPGYDVAVVWDYREMSDGWLEDILDYGEIVVVAWSFGVHAAARFIVAHPQLPVTARIAVNGTRFTADDERGIPRAIFDGTLNGLSERSVAKFNMRMCGGSAAYKEFAASAPERGVDDLREELRSFDTAPARRMLWDKAFVSRGDLIIPPTAQLKAWADEAVEVVEIDGPHLPDFNAILRRCLTDKSHVERRFRKAERTYDENASAQLASARRLVDLASPYVAGTPARMLEVGCGTGRSTALALERFSPREALLFDLHISPQVEALCRTHVGVSAVGCDGESEISMLDDGRFDLILSASTVQWFNSLRAFLVQVERTLVSGGVAAISTYGPDTMREIHQAVGTECRFPSRRRLMHMLPEWLELVEVIEERCTVVYDTPLDVLRHVSHTGVNGLDPERNGAGVASRLLRNYPVDADGRAPLTYHPIYLILRKL